MQYVTTYPSPLGEIILVSNGRYLNGLWFKNQKNPPQILSNNIIENDNNILTNTKKWLDIYFTGHQPPFQIPLHFTGTPFQNKIWNILLTIPFGQILTYSDIAKIYAHENKLKHVSSQAVGSAIAHNPISIIIPCHRIVGKNNHLTGYAGGINRKKHLLENEGIDTSKMLFPKNYPYIIE